MQQEGLTVLSLFDGMSCGQIALERAGIRVQQYYASEIKKSGIKVTQHHYPNTIQLGNVCDVRGSDLPKIDLLIGGSPCQDLSLVNQVRAGLQGEKSKLFYEYLRLLQETKPTFFLLENVGMTGDNKEIISSLLGCEPVEINSALVSGQNRKRLYWTNIGPYDKDLFGRRLPLIPQPADKNIKLAAILDSGWAPKRKAGALLAETGKRNPYEMCKRHNTVPLHTYVYKDEVTYRAMMAEYANGNSDSEIFSPENIRVLSRGEREQLQTVPDGYTDCVSFNAACNLLGDGWTVDVIAHIFRFLPSEYHAVWETVESEEAFA